MWGNRGKIVAVMLGLSLVAVATVIPPSGAEEDYLYRTEIAGHPLEPYAQLPYELDTGFPSTFVELSKTPELRSQSTSALAEPTPIGDGVVGNVTSHKYENPSKAWAVNPPDHRDTKAAINTFPYGPTATAECPTTFACVGSTTYGRYVSDNFSIESASTDSSSTASDADQLISSESMNKIQGLKVGGLSISSILSWLKVDLRPGKEPTISYKVQISGIEDGKGFTGAGYQGILLSGQNVAGSDLAKQFNAQVKNGDGPFSTIGKYGLRVVEPRFGQAQTGRYVLELSALDGSIQPAARKNQVGGGFGMRIGATRFAGNYGPDGPLPSGWGYLDDPSNPNVK
jgi:hypothetical protein